MIFLIKIIEALEEEKCVSNSRPFQLLSELMKDIILECSEETKEPRSSLCQLQGQVSAN